MPEPLAYLITWTTYGSWLLGDARGWVEGGTPGVRAGDPAREAAARDRLLTPPVVLSEAQRSVVEATIRDHCRFRGWQLHAVSARSNHVHVVATAPVAPETVMNQFKAWCSRRLNEQTPGRGTRWWTAHGSTKWIGDEGCFRNAVRYVLERK
jgi:REP element-mobilizing transposase RayT